VNTIPEGRDWPPAAAKRDGVVAPNSPEAGLFAPKGAGGGWVNAGSVSLDPARERSGDSDAFYLGVLQNGVKVANAGGRLPWLPSWVPFNQKAPEVEYDPRVSSNVRYHLLKMVPSGQENEYARALDFAEGRLPRDAALIGEDPKIFGARLADLAEMASVNARVSSTRAAAQYAQAAISVVPPSELPKWLETIGAVKAASLAKALASDSDPRSREMLTRVLTAINERAAEEAKTDAEGVAKDALKPAAQQFVYNTFVVGGFSGDDAYDMTLMTALARLEFHGYLPNSALDMYSKLNKGGYFDTQEHRANRIGMLGALPLEPRKVRPSPSHKPKAND
jgi:hypothetical protein